MLESKKNVYAQWCELMIDQVALENLIGNIVALKIHPQGNSLARKIESLCFILEKLKFARGIGS